MFQDMTRSRLIQGWFAVVTLVVVAGIAFGVDITLSTAAIALMLSVVPAAIVFRLWPKPQPATAADVLYSGDRRD